MIACEKVLAGFSQPAKMWGNSINRLAFLLLLGTFVLAIRGEFFLTFSVKRVTYGSYRLS